MYKGEMNRGLLLNVGIIAGVILWGLAWTAACSGADYLFLTLKDGSGVFIDLTNGSQLAEFEATDRIYRVDLSGDQPDPDPPTDRVERLTAIARQTLDATQARAVALLVKTIADSGITDGTRAVRTSIVALAGMMGDEGEAVTAWHRQTTAVVNTYDQGAMRDILAAIKAAHNVEPSAEELAAARAMAAGDRVDLDRWERIIQFVLRIIEILRSLGIIKIGG